MAKTYKKISGTWYPIKKIFKRISGSWYEVKKLYKKVSGTWQLVHTGVFEYTFSANASNVDFATLIGASNVANYTDFKITINSGITVSGTDGITGANNSSAVTAIGNAGTRTCRDSITTAGTIKSFSYTNYPANSVQYRRYHTGNGGTGGNGNVALSFSGMSGKNISVINNGTIRGGNGGNGGMGALQVRTSTIEEINDVGCGAYSIVCGLNGSAGNGGLAIANGTNTVNISGNSPINGSGGAVASTPWAKFNQETSGCG